MGFIILLGDQFEIDATVGLHSMRLKREGTGNINTCTRARPKVLGRDRLQ